MAIVEINEDIKDIVPDFIRHREEDLEIMEHSLKEEDFKKMESIGHKLAGNAPAYGFIDLGPIGQKIESAAQLKKLDELKELERQYRDYLSNLEIIYK